MARTVPLTSDDESASQGRTTQGAVMEIPVGIRDEMIAHAVRDLPNEACGLLAGRFRRATPSTGEKTRGWMGRWLAWLSRRDKPAVIVAQHVDRYYPIRNHDQSPETYTLDDKEHQAALDDIDRRKLDLVGVFHSHTHTAAVPSNTDLEKSDGPRSFYPGAYFVLVSLRDVDAPELRVFSIDDSGAAEQEVMIT